jgi:4-hydroxy-tetrahydrodipicolinate synthase
MNPFVPLTREMARTLRCIPAMPTIFSSNGLGSGDAPIDHRQQKLVIEFLLTGKVDAIVVCGTTGEAATQSHDEQLGFISWAIGNINGRVPVIAGCGSNCTQEAVRLARGAMKAGANAGLLVKPYYNKPGFAGLLAHYREVAEVGLPFITYSVSSRHGGGAIPVEVIAQLAEEFPHHIGHKEAEGKYERFGQLRQACPKDFVIWSGDDGITAEVMAQNYCEGVISVAANVVPAEVKMMVEYFAHANGLTSDDRARGFGIHHRLEKLFGKDGLFMQTSPQPVKAAMEMLGIIDKACFRLPLVPMDQENPADVDTLRQLLADLGLMSSD